MKRVVPFLGFLSVFLVAAMFLFLAGVAIASQFGQRNTIRAPVTVEADVIILRDSTGRRWRVNVSRGGQLDVLPNNQPQGWPRNPPRLPRPGGP
jgi:hypothetical protein